MQIIGNRFLITGGASLIGSHLTTALLDAGAAGVVLYDNLSLGSSGVLDEFARDTRVTVVRSDILRLPSLIDALAGIDGVFALAGYLTIPFARQPAIGADVNIMGMVTTLEAVRLAGRGKVVFASSVAVYGSDIHGRVDETRPFRTADLSPASACYGASKLLGEGLGRLYAQQHGIEFCAVRFSTVYGERQHTRGVNALYMLDALNAARAGRPITIRGSGNEAHDYLYAGDAARGCVLTMEKGETGQVFNLASGQSTSVNEIVRMVLDECGSAVAPEHVPDTRAVRSTDHDELQIAIDRATSELGWTPRVSIREGIGRLRRWLDAEASRPGDRAVAQ